MAADAFAAAGRRPASLSLPLAPAMPPSPDAARRRRRRARRARGGRARAAAGSGLSFGSTVGLLSGESDLSVLHTRSNAVHSWGASAVSLLIDSGTASGTLGSDVLFAALSTPQGVARRQINSLADEATAQAFPASRQRPSQGRWLATHLSERSEPELQPNRDAASASLYRGSAAMGSSDLQLTSASPASPSASAEGAYPATFLQMLEATDGEHLQRCVLRPQRVLRRCSAPIAEAEAALSSRLAIDLADDLVAHFVKEGESGFDEGLRPDNTQCAICLDDFCAGDVVQPMLDCRHLFHCSCMHKFILARSRTLSSRSSALAAFCDQVTCPLCRGRVLSHSSDQLPIAEREKAVSSDHLNAAVSTSEQSAQGRSAHALQHSDTTEIDESAFEV
eukprot:TRINITY_DN26252_c0_g1_i1.p1 TRINITY_DN26252_c0_g1~~TRINITY_DN26252_c0_g1_i1.p1  ORF type:complete len:405 (+),score=59.00 TRINITY_DN26252_c0_g1_i1:38-1216(+)